MRRANFHIALAAVQLAVCIGAAYLKNSLSTVSVGAHTHIHPVVFAFLREAVAGPLLLLGAYLFSRVIPDKEDLWAIASAGLFLYLNQLFYILGVHLSGVVLASCIQPAIPVITAALAIVVGQECASVLKLSGIAFAVVGSVAVVAGSTQAEERAVPASSAISRHAQLLLGNACLVGNTVAMACYYLRAKTLLAKYTPLSVSAWAYLAAATSMGITAALTVTDTSDWVLPSAAYGPLLYWIIVCSVVGYCVVAWATQHLPASEVAAFQCLQPFIGTAIAVVWLHESLTPWHLGAVGVVIGLLLVTRQQQGPGSVLIGKTHLDLEDVDSPLAEEGLIRASMHGDELPVASTLQHLVQKRGLKSRETE